MDPLTDSFFEAAVGTLFPIGANVHGIWETLRCNFSHPRIREELEKLGYTPQESERGTYRDLSSEQRYNLVFETTLNVAQGANRLRTQNFDQEEVAAFPALELLRVYSREIPRGLKRGPRGTLIPVPNDDWPHRFRDAINACADSAEDKATMLRILESTRRMIALKSSCVWQELGTNRDDTLGNSYPPFAFNSGFDVNVVARNETEQLGLIKAAEKAKLADIPPPEEMILKFISKLRRYLAKLEEDEQKRHDNPLTFGISEDLLDLAYEKLDASGELSKDRTEEIESLIELAVERGMGEDDKLIKQIREDIIQSQKTDAERQANRISAFGESYFLIESAEGQFAGSKEMSPEISRQIFDLVERSFKNGIGSQFNLRARAHKLLMKVYERLQEPEKAEDNRQLYVENASGYMLLADAQMQLETIGKQAIELNVGAKILDMLSKAVKTIPESDCDKHAEAYRITAEVLEAIGDIPNAIQYYEFALQKNSKIHVKRQLNSLRKNQMNILKS